ncbi:hypothetical protein BT93_I0640 [Corymbia citriodora subsp. variegata]|nr:hypothetical protein BT93_I0640 [Corymbia citriodora subsp. variegata]
MGPMINLWDLPIGYRFHPTGEEIVTHYLRRRVQGIVDHRCIIPNVDICLWDPWALRDKFHDESIIGRDDQVQEWWFFSPYTPQKVKRSTPSGYWKKTGDDKEVKARATGTAIGTRKYLVFYKGRGKKADRTDWVIHEYHLLANDLNRTHVLCHLKHERDEKANNSTIESEHGAINLADFELYLHQPDDEDLFPESLVQEKMTQLVELIRPENRAEFVASFLQWLDPAPGSQNNGFPSNLHQPMNIEGPSVMDMPWDNDFTDESSQLMSGRSEEDEDVGDMQNADLAYARFLEGYMQPEYDLTSNWPHEHPVLMNRRARTTDSVHGFVALEEKKGVVEKFNGSPVASENPKPHPVPGVCHGPMAPPIRPASAKRYSKDEEPRLEKVAQETVAINIKPERISSDKTAARAKYKGRGSDGNSTKKANSKEIKYAREKSNLVAASTRTTSKSTESPTNPPLSNFVNAVVAFLVLLIITRLVLGF